MQLSDLIATSAPNILGIGYQRCTSGEEVFQRQQTALAVFGHKYSAAPKWVDGYKEDRNNIE